MLTSRDELFEVLGRDPTLLIGEPETVWLDFKSQSYMTALPAPAGDHAKFELAKDLSAMANKQGGVILLGILTEQDPNTREDVAKELRPLPAGLVDPTAIRQIARDWIFPPLDVEVRSHSVTGFSGTLWTLAVNQCHSRDYPHLVTKNFVGENASDNIFGAFERSSTDNFAYSPRQLHGWLARGSRRADETEELLPRPTRQPEDANEVLTEDLVALELPENAAGLILQAAANGAMLRDFYRGGDDPLYDRMSRPQHHLRDGAGFDLPDLGRPERTPRGALRVTWKANDSVSVTRSGLATAIQGESHLTWAHERFAPKGEIWINPIALIEFTLDFFRFFLAEVLPRAGGSDYQWRVGITGALTGGTLYLPERFGGFPNRESSNEDRFLTDWTLTDERDAPILAYQALAEIYARFGMDPAVMPHSKEGRIDEQSILDIK